MKRILTIIFAVMALVACKKNDEKDTEEQTENEENKESKENEPTEEGEESKEAGRQRHGPKALGTTPSLPDRRRGIIDPIGHTITSGAEYVPPGIKIPIHP